MRQLRRADSSRVAGWDLKLVLASVQRRHRGTLRMFASFETPRPDSYREGRQCSPFLVMRHSRECGNLIIENFAVINKCINFEEQIPTFVGMTVPPWRKTGRPSRLLSGRGVTKIADYRFYFNATKKDLIASP